MKVLSVVCARAGSKGLRNKCMRRIGEKPIVRYAIEYSLVLGSKVRTVVSTDIPELIADCRNRAVRCIVRNPIYCKDTSRIDDALAEAAVTHGDGCDWISIVYGNIPTRYPQIFQEAVHFLDRNPDYDAAISMQNVEKFHPDWMFDFDEDLLPSAEERNYRRQALPQKMIHDGHTLIFRRQPFLERYDKRVRYDKRIRYGIFGSRIKPVLNSYPIVDIDTEKDFRLAEALLRHGVGEGLP